MAQSSCHPRLSWWTKRKLYRLAHYLLHEHNGVHARPMERYCERTRTDTSFTDWAIDFRNCGMSCELDAFYLQPDNSYRSIPTNLKAQDLALWKNVRAKAGLVHEGERLLHLLYE